jgi:hypothetical protein
MMEATFRWRSWLGAAVIFFLIVGLVYFVSAILVPLSLHVNGSDALSGPGVVFSGTGDAQLLGRSSLIGLHHDSPRLDTLLVDSMTSMCAMMMGWAIVMLSVTWFGLRRGQRWAYWALLLSLLVSLVYYFVISSDYSSQGATWSDGLAAILLFSIPGLLGMVTGGVAVARGLPAERPTAR